MTEAIAAANAMEARMAALPGVPPGALPQPLAAPPTMRAHIDVQMDVAPDGPVAIPTTGIEEVEVHARGVRSPTESSAEEI